MVVQRLPCWKHDARVVFIDHVCSGMDERRDCDFSQIPVSRAYRRGSRLAITYIHLGTVSEVGNSPEIYFHPQWSARSQCDWWPLKNLRLQG